MQLFAVTYTDPSEPWGAAVLDRKLYRTPSAVCDAANAHFDAWLAVQRWRDSDETHGDYLKEQYERYPAGDHYCSLEQYMADEWSREFGFGCYEVVKQVTLDTLRIL